MGLFSSINIAATGMSVYVSVPMLFPTILQMHLLQELPKVVNSKNKQ